MLKDTIPKDVTRFVFLDKRNDYKELCKIFLNLVSVCEFAEKSKGKEEKEIRKLLKELNDILNERLKEIKSNGAN